jgi:hypothetical protein
MSVRRPPVVTVLLVVGLAVAALVTMLVLRSSPPPLQGYIDGMYAKTPSEVLFLVAVTNHTKSAADPVCVVHLSATGHHYTVTAKFTNIGVVGPGQSGVSPPATVHVPEDDATYITQSASSITCV